MEKIQLIITTLFLIGVIMFAIGVFIFSTPIGFMFLGASLLSMALLLNKENTERRDKE